MYHIKHVDTHEVVESLHEIDAARAILRDRSDLYLHYDSSVIGVPLDNPATARPHYVTCSACGVQEGTRKAGNTYMCSQCFTVEERKEAAMERLDRFDMPDLPH